MIHDTMLLRHTLTTPPFVGIISVEDLWRSRDKVIVDTSTLTHLMWWPHCVKKIKQAKIAECRKLNWIYWYMQRISSEGRREPNRKESTVCEQNRKRPDGSAIAATGAGQTEHNIIDMSTLCGSTSSGCSEDGDLQMGVFLLILAVMVIGMHVLFWIENAVIRIPLRSNNECLLQKVILNLCAFLAGTLFMLLLLLSFHGLNTSNRGVWTTRHMSRTRGMTINLCF